MVGGPFVVAKVLSLALYEVKDRQTERVVGLHHDCIKRYLDLSVPFWMRRSHHQITGDGKAPGDKQLDRTVSDETSASDVNTDLGGLLLLDTDLTNVRYIKHKVVSE